MVKSIHQNHPALFDLPEDDEGDGDGEEESTEGGGPAPLSNYGILPFVLTYCQLAHETLTAAMRESVLQVLYVYNYEHDRRILDESNRQAYQHGGFSGIR